MPQKISVVIPTIEEESLFSLVERIRRSLGKGIEIIIVDKSGDAYYERLKSLGATIIRQKDRGVESAIMQGLRRAKGDILASVDADETHDISGLAEGVKLIESGKADLVLGNRMGGLESGSMDSYIRVGNSSLSWIFSRLYKTDIHDVMTGLFVMRRKAFESIREVEPYRAGIAFFAIELARLGYRVREVNIKYYKRRHGKSKLTKSKLAYGVNVASHLIRLSSCSLTSGNDTASRTHGCRNSDRCTLTPAACSQLKVLSDTVYSGAMRRSIRQSKAASRMLCLMARMSCPARQSNSTSLTCSRGSISTTT